MKVNVLDKRIDTLKDGTMRHVLLVLAPVSKYGNIVKQAIEVVVPNVAKYDLGETDLNIVLPYSDYPYHLV